MQLRRTGIPPSLLSGFHRADSPPFKQYYEDAKTALPFSTPSVSLGVDTLRYHLFFACNKVVISTLFTRIITVRSILANRFSWEALGSPVFPCFPYLPLIWSRTPVESPQLSRLPSAGLTWPQLTKQLRLLTTTTISRLNTYLQ
jgi:hypothetical protein